MTEAAAGRTNSILQPKRWIASAEISASLPVWHGRQCLIAMVRDIAERKEAEAAGDGPRFAGLPKNAALGEGGFQSFNF